MTEINRLPFNVDKWKSLPIDWRSELQCCEGEGNETGSRTTDKDLQLLAGHKPNTNNGRGSTEILYYTVRYVL